MSELSDSLWDLPRSRPEAKRLGAKFYFTGKPCKHGHVDKRYAHGNCFSCVSSLCPDSWPAKNPEKKRESSLKHAAKPETKARAKENAASRRDELNDYHARWRAGEVGEKGGAIYKEKQRVSFAAWRDDQMANNPRYRVIKRLRDRIRCACGHRGTSKTTKTAELIGCSPDELVAHLEAQFEPGMTWKNMGQGGWHIDHIWEIALFEDPEDPRCWHYTNLRPRWEAENLSSGQWIRWNPEHKYSIKPLLAS